MAAVPISQPRCFHSPSSAIKSTGRLAWPILALLGRGEKLTSMTASSRAGAPNQRAMTTTMPSKKSWFSQNQVFTLSTRSSTCSTQDMLSRKGGG